MKRSTTPTSKSKKMRLSIVAVAVLMVASATTSVMPRVSADNYDVRIAELQREIDSYQAAASKLDAKADSLQKKLNSIQNDIAQLEARIKLNEEKRKKIVAEIEETKKEIAENREALGEVLADLSIEGDITALEMLASSRNISDYVDKQTYQESMQDELNATIKRINDLKIQLEKQKKEVEVALGEQKLAKSALDKKRSEQARLVSQTRGQESAYRALSGKAAAEQRRVQQQQQAAIQAALARNGAGSLGAGGSLSSYRAWLGKDCYVDGNAMSYSVDHLGYGCNQCVSYAAYMVERVTGYQAAWWGNAGMWPASAESTGRFKVSNVPRGNSLGVMLGDPGHIVYVHSFNRSSYTVNISQYNYNYGAGWGKYSTQNGVGAGTYQQYIYLD
jgi:peptidoglycan hydrolase CwlO-like protein/surface antigen